MITVKFLRPYVTWNYSSPTPISMYKYIHLHIDMGINLLSCVTASEYVTTRLLLLPLYKNKFNTYTAINQIIR